MSIEGLIFGLILAAATTLLIINPFFIKTASPAPLEAAQRNDMLAQYEIILTNIRDIEMDYNSGKMPEDDYQSERAEWVERGVALLQQIDTLSDNIPAASSLSDEDHTRIDAEVEALITAYHNEQESNSRDT
ncbi:MAG: hypothetical protein ACPG7F_18995 [Aggregatilineales bacterium]